MNETMLRGKLPENYCAIKHPTWDNIFWQAETNKLLYEGIYATYPIEKVKKYLSSYYKIPPQCINIIDNNGDQSLKILISNVPENKKEMDKSLALCGYFPSFETEIQNGEFLEIDYEKRINDDADSFVRKQRYIYHITPSVNVDKIEELGLCPKTQNKKFNYPNRIYFYTGKLTPKHVMEFGRMLYNHIQQNDYTKEHGVYDNFALIQIDTKQLNFDEISFYRDPNLDGAVYTMDNIPPEYTYVKYRNINICKEEKDFFVKHGIEKEPCGSIGFSEKEQKWYGWSHRAIYGFGIGSKCKKGDVHYNGKEWAAKTLKDAKKMAEDFAEAVS